MFRKMLREKQRLTQEECVGILTREKRGVLSVLGDEGYPYGIPMNHWYCPENGHIYFHSGKTGHKVDAITRYEKASFCVYDEGVRKDGEWWLTICSVVVFGQIRIVEDMQQALEISRKLSLKFTRDTDYIEKEISRSGPAVLCFELIPEHITGKRVAER